MSVSQLARSIKASPTLKLNETAAKLREKGEPVIHLGGGEPKSKAPLDAVLNCATQLNTGEVRYAPADGLPALKKAIIRYTEENYGRLHGPRERDRLERRQAVDHEHPVRDPRAEGRGGLPGPLLGELPRDGEARGRRRRCRSCPRTARFQPSVPDIADKVGSYTKAVILNSPNNPSGVMYPADFVAEIVEFCEKKNLWLIMDDLYNRLVFDGQKAPNPLRVREGHRRGLAARRRPGRLEDVRDDRLPDRLGDRQPRAGRGHDQHPGAPDLGPASPCRSGRRSGALSGVQTSIESLRLTLENNRNVMLERLQTIPGVHVTKPDGTFYCFPDFSAYMKDSQKLAELLLERVRVVTVPGKEFGMDGHLRLSYCGTIKEIMDGLERIKWALDPKAPNELFLGDRKLVRDWA